MLTTYGVHHLSSMVGHAQRNIDFYAKVLKYRLVKQTLNLDDKNMYHLYCGIHDASSELITTFPMNNTTEKSIGAGQVEVAGYAIRPETLNYLEKYLREFNIKTFDYTRFHKKRLGFQDLDELEIERSETSQRPDNQWSFNKVTTFKAIVGLDDAFNGKRRD